MLSTLFVRDPYNFAEKRDDVQKVLSSNISWPKGYIPEDHPIVKPKVKKTREEVAREALYEKHRIHMDPLNPYYLDETITNLTRVANTENAYQTYKESGWKSTFNKIKGVSIAKKLKEEKELRADCIDELPEKLQ